MTRSRILSLAVCLFSAAGCGGSNEPALASNSSSAAASGSKSEASGSGGKSSSTSTTSATSPTSSGGQAGKPAAASGNFSPLCSDVPATAAGAPTKGGACSATDPQLCYKTCGPQSVGFKSEMCMNAAYVEQSGCSFPDADYSCYKIPAMPDASCPKTAPQATMPCDVVMCTPCSVDGNYLDSSGASKQGYCVCPMAGDAGTRKWSCASSTAWPCPLGKGC